jgi:hypothetical protein
MKPRSLSTLLYSAVLLMPLAFTAGCAHEISHTESDKPGWFGGRTREETTVYKNTDGTTSTAHEKQTTNP